MSDLKDFNLGGGGGVPVGTIIAWVGGYFTSSSNGGFTNVIGNDATTINTLITDDGFKVCNGAQVNDPDSPIFNVAGRYLPNLTDDRFLSGGTTAGGIGGSSTMAHTHTHYHTHATNIGSFNSGSSTLSIAQLASHRHGITVFTGGGTDWIEGGNDSGRITKYSDYTGSNSSHYHTVNPPSTTSGNPSVTSTAGASVTENRPKFLSCFYIMKIK